EVAQDRARQDARVKAENTLVDIDNPAAPGGKISVTQAFLQDHPGFATAASPVQLEALQGMNKDWIDKTWRPVKTAGGAGNANLAALDALDAVPLDTGNTAAMKTWLNKAGTVLGIPGAEEYVGNVQKFQSVVMSKLQQNLALQAGPQTEGD